VSLETHVDRDDVEMVERHDEVGARHKYACPAVSNVAELSLVALGVLIGRLGERRRS
jgi:hypothetical protein